MNLSRAIIENCAAAAGFDLCGVAEVGHTAWVRDHFDLWCSKGYNAAMEWTLKNGEVRANPSLLLPDAKSVVCVGLSYLRDKPDDHLALLYQGVDYHHLMKERMTHFVSLLKANSSFDFEFRICVDSAPVFEKYWAVKSGLGWIGRNSLLINRNIGSFFVLGEIFIDKPCDLYHKEEPFNGCGTCRRCQTHCPTAALCDEGVVDARRCLSYLTIEHRGDFLPEQIPLVGSAENQSFFGCDRCQEVCPWNKKAAKQICSEKKNRTASLFRQTEFDFTRQTLLNLSPSKFKRAYRATALFRTSLKNILRNIRVIL